MQTMVMKMEHGGILQHQLPLHADYALPLEQDCADHCGSNIQHDGYGNGGVELMRRDSAINHQVPAAFYAQAHASTSARFLAERSVGEVTHSGSISTSPSSAASSLAYTSYPTHYTNVQHLPGSVQLGQAFVPSSFAEPRPSTLLDTPTHMLPPLPRTINALPQPLDNRDGFSANNTPYLNRTQISTPTIANYSYIHAETPRSLLSGTTNLSLSPNTSPYSNGQMASNNGNFTPSPNDCEKFPWADLESVTDMTCEGQLLVPKILPKIDKGFFADKSTWTCYRRNYFSVTCSFELHPNVANGRITIRRGNSLERVQAMGMRLAAAIDGPEGKSIELIQHTPKRDAGPKTKVEIVKVSPKPSASRAEQALSPSGMYQVPSTNFLPTGHYQGPYLPLQATPEADAVAGAAQTVQPSSQYSYSAQSQQVNTSGTKTEHAFERVQFKQATANNGKRRATQQFFHLIIELFADVRKDGADKPVWVKVAHRVSDKVVVRGRSPSHYQNEKGENSNMTNRSMPSGSISGYGAMGGSGYVGLNAGAFRSIPHPTYISANGVGLRKGEFHSDHGSQSDSSASSLEEAHTMDTSYVNDTLMTEAERVGLHEAEGYQYYPNAVYEQVQGTLLPPIAKLNGDHNLMGDKMYTVKGDYVDAVSGAQFQPAGLSRFQGVDTSRGYYSDLQRF